MGLIYIMIKAFRDERQFMKLVPSLIKSLFISAKSENQLKIYAFMFYETFIEKSEHNQN
jgi:hypothetical protein